MPTYDDILKEKERRKKRSESQQRCIANKAAKESPEETRARKEENNRRKREIKAIMHGKDPKAEEAAFQKRKLGHQVRRQMEKDKKAAEEQATGYESNDSRELLTSDNRSVGPARPEGPTYPDPPRQDHNATFAMTSMRSSVPPTISTQPATSHDHSSSMSDPQHSAHTSYHDSRL
ncbi:uncharacterized protein EAF02_007618 [Botrytis sinoallii]|uniref:uncharacterized protein n=1 Tax=Botrytis sinoallii TaxID=1463999 RepID=UPI0018FFBDBE|nr:uncharacterized protein EAF02_007618 [Botrytis sinoallii]KAF7879981.1 hypothetical protein EAF02_007618 [Botrytis sinoallii]